MTPPSLGWLKCNVDASFNRNFGTWNRGWCVRDNSGNFFLAGVAWDVGNLSILETEALALKEAIQGVVAMCILIELYSKAILFEWFKPYLPILLEILSLIL